MVEIPRRFSKIMVGLLAIHLLMVSCSQPDLTPSTSKSVFNHHDDRIPAPNWLPIGTFGNGTAFAVGQRTIMTSAHDTFELPPQARFEMRDGSSYIVTTVLGVGRRFAPGEITEKDVNQDWAVMQVDHDLPVFFKVAEDVGLDESIQLAGFSRDRPDATLDPECNVRMIRDNILFHDCGMTPGASGSPLFVRRGGGDGLENLYVIGVQSAQRCARVDGNCLYQGDWSVNTSNLATKITETSFNLVHNDHAARENYK